jgi:hypothetical protein
MMWLLVLDARLRFFNSVRYPNSHDGAISSDCAAVVVKYPVGQLQ